jgi:N-acetylmuramoyl-L-alanine amidase
MSWPRMSRWYRRMLPAILVLTTMPAACTAVAPRPSLESLPIILRSQWGAVEPDLNAPAEHGLYDAKTNPDGWLVYTKPLSQVLTTIVVHHSALPLSDGPLQIQQLHMHDKGYADIGYHFVIDPAGRIFEGRKLYVRGAHTGGHNTGTVGIVLLGNFEEAQPTAAQLASLKALAAALAAEYGIKWLAGHRDFQPDETVCPGRNLEVLLPGLAAELGLKFGTAGYVGPTP